MTTNEILNQIEERAKQMWPLNYQETVVLGYIPRLCAAVRYLHSNLKFEIMPNDYLGEEMPFETKLNNILTGNEGGDSSLAPQTTCASAKSTTLDQTAVPSTGASNPAPESPNPSGGPGICEYCSGSGKVLFIGPKGVYGSGPCTECNPNAAPATNEPELPQLLTELADERKGEIQSSLPPKEDSPFIRIRCRKCGAYHNYDESMGIDCIALCIDCLHKVAKEESTSVKSTGEPEVHARINLDDVKSPEDFKFIIDALTKERDKVAALLKRAWGVIKEGDWKLESQEWRKCAAAWRDDYFYFASSFKKHPGRTLPAVPATGNPITKAGSDEPVQCTCPDWTSFGHEPGCPYLEKLSNQQKPLDPSKVAFGVASEWVADEYGKREQLAKEIQSAIDRETAALREENAKLWEQKSISDLAGEELLRERDQLRAQVANLESQNQTFRNAQKACEDCDGPTMEEVKQLRAQLAEAKQWIEEAQGVLIQHGKDSAYLCDERAALETAIARKDEALGDVMRAHGIYDRAVANASKGFSEIYMDTGNKIRTALALTPQTCRDRIAELEAKVTKMKTLSQKVNLAQHDRIRELEAKLTEEQQLREFTNRDWADTHTRIVEMARPFLGDWVDGMEEPSFVCELQIMERLCEKMKALSDRITLEETNELRDVLRTIAPSGRAFITSARELVSVFERQQDKIRELEEKVTAIAKERDEVQARSHDVIQASRLAQYATEELGWNGVTNSKLLSVFVSDYIQQLRSEVADLRAWKASALAVEASWNDQSVAKLIGVPLGAEIRPAIEPWIRKTIAELAELRRDKERIDWLSDQDIVTLSWRHLESYTVTMTIAPAYGNITSCVSLRSAIDAIKGGGE